MAQNHLRTDVIFLFASSTASFMSYCKSVSAAYTNSESSFFEISSIIFATFFSKKKKRKNVKKREKNILKFDKVKIQVDFPDIFFPRIEKFFTPLFALNH